MYLGFAYNFPSDLNFCMENGILSFEGEYFTYFMEIQAIDNDSQEDAIGYRSKYAAEHIPTRHQLNFTATTAPTLTTVAPADYLFDFDLQPSLVWYSNQWRKTNYDTLKMEYVAMNTSQRLNKHENGAHLCYYFSDKFDGMKTKLLNLISMIPEDEFHHTFFLCKEKNDKKKNKKNDNDDNDNSFENQLKNTEARIDIHPCIPSFHINRKDWDSKPSKQSSPFSNLPWPFLSFGSIADGSFNEYKDEYYKGPESFTDIPEDYNPDVYAALEYVHHRFVDAKLNISIVEPLWCRKFLKEIEKTLLKKIQLKEKNKKNQKKLKKKDRCDILMIGNDRSPYTSLIIAVATSLDMATIMELPNLKPHSMSRPNIVVGDSTFAIRDESVRDILQNFIPMPINRLPQFEDKLYIYNDARQEMATRVILMSPGVNVKNTRVNVPFIIDKHQRNKNYHEGTSGLFRIGFIARLSKEKAIVLFLLAIRDLIYLGRRYNIRAIIIGDGPLKSDLQDICITLDIQWAVEFRGWLPKRNITEILHQEIDCVVNTGAWKEIFNNVNLEVLSSGVPLITFATGGVGEYIVNPYETGFDQCQVVLFLFREFNPLGNSTDVSAIFTKGIDEDLINYCVKFSFLHPERKVHKFHINMRTKKMRGVTETYDIKQKMFSQLPFVIGHNAVVVLEPSSVAIAGGTHTHIYTYIYIHIHIYTYIYIYTYLCMCVSMRIVCIR